MECGLLRSTERWSVNNGSGGVGSVNVTDYHVGTNIPAFAISRHRTVRSSIHSLRLYLNSGTSGVRVFLRVFQLVFKPDTRSSIVSGTVSDPGFARQEESFLLDPRRLLVAISRARLLSIVVCSTSLFGIAPEDSDHLATGPIWARLFTQAVGRDTAPAWAGPLAEFVGDEDTDHATVPVQVYSSTVDPDGGER